MFVRQWVHASYEPCSLLLTSGQKPYLAKARGEPRAATQRARLWLWAVLGVRRSCAQQKLLLMTVLGLQGTALPQLPTPKRKC